MANVDDYQQLAQELEQLKLNTEAAQRAVEEDWENKEQYLVGNIRYQQKLLAQVVSTAKKLGIDI
jgi:hypothetical protein